MMEMINRVNELASELGWEVVGFTNYDDEELRISFAHKRVEDEPEDG